MIIREDSEERRTMSQLLVQVMCGLTPLREIEDSLKTVGFGIRRIDEPEYTRFIVFVRKTGKVYDTFQYEDIEFGDGLEFKP